MRVPSSGHPTRTSLPGHPVILTRPARAFPGTQIVLDHVGGAIGLGPYAGKRDEVFVAWSRQIHELATCPNVHIKLGGLGMRMFGFTHYLGTTSLQPAYAEVR